MRGLAQIVEIRRSRDPYDHVETLDLTYEADMHVVVSEGSMPNDSMKRSSSVSSEHSSRGEQGLIRTELPHECLEVAASIVRSSDRISFCALESSRSRSYASTSLDVWPGSDQMKGIGHLFRLQSVEIFILWL